MKIRCSQLGAFLTRGRGKDQEFGLTALDVIRQVKIGNKYGRWPVFANKYVTKGNVNELEALNMINQVLGTSFVRDVLNYQNEFITGSPDVLSGDLVLDIKNSFDIWTFDKAELTKDYEAQLRGYMWLTGATKAKLVYCLTDAPDWMIEAEKRKLYYGMGGDNADMAAYQKAAEQIEKNMKFGDIPEADRVKVFDIERDEQWEIDLAERILKAREI